MAVANLPFCRCRKIEGPAPDTPIINNMAEGRSENSLSHIDLRKPRYNQSTYFGRARHFFEVTDPRNVIASSAKLEEARDLVTAHR